MKIITTLDKSPYIIAAYRLLETSVVVTLLGFLATLVPALSSVDNFRAYDWRSALAALALGVASGVVNAAVTALNLYLQSLKGTAS